MLEVQRLQLELARVDREIQRARGRAERRRQRAGAAPRGGQAEFDRAYGRVLEETGDREG